MTQEILNKYIASLPDTWMDYPFGEGVAVYKVGEPEKSKMFVLVQEDSQPLRISVKCDPGLAEMLREKYETVVPGYHLNKKHWNTIICSGQLTNEEILDLVRHSYELIHPTI